MTTRLDLGPGWPLANALGLGLGLTAIRLVVPGFRGDQFQGEINANILVFIIATGIPVGLGMSLLQWLVIRRVIPRSQRWIWLTLFGLVLGWLLSLVVAIPLGVLISILVPHQSSLTQTIIRYSIAGLIGGLIGLGLGFAQSVALRGWIDHPLRWVWVSMGSGAIGFVVMLATLALLDPLVPPTTPGLSQLVSFLAGALGGVAGSIMTRFEL